MADKQAGAFCQVCQQQRLFLKPGINHILHLILTVLTFGLWAIVWVILAATSSGKGYRCSVCGTQMGMAPIAPTALAQQPAPAAPPSAAIPPGWHADPAQGVLRWWDGSQWTDQVAPEGTSPPPPTESDPPPKANESDETAPALQAESSESKTSPPAS
jgi:hypothetical protein